MQLCPEGHTVPQRPQYEVSLDVGTQRPPQSVWPEGHVHEPDTHDCPLAQAFPHAPQLATSLAEFTQRAPQ